MRKIILLLITLSLFACDQKNRKHQQSDKFYIEKGGFDEARIPLIKPYEITSPSTNSNWIAASVDTTEVPVTIPGTEHINVVDSVIFIYSQKTVLDGQPIDQAWFIIIPKNHLLRGFKSHQEYLNYISSIEIREPKMYNVSEVFHYFDQKDTLDWSELNRLY
ncbi:hypothetical protein [Mucilaginibacter pocheonensis]|uniref:Uncharacterized protein n=1 Tax=Mucilaginibacter pocheonensis TaxID=398050 RepID=A0ABU1TI48_9SPHI|nr:hypothetical protein [Mucilaginibacter pocheonensis]MDR6945081.1 hypothetical protein [Mucilaginibacter pocheonensis]